MHPRGPQTPMPALPNVHRYMTTPFKEQPMAWTWRIETSEGDPVALESGVPAFTSQSDAESWLGEVWRELADEGAGQATLLEHDRDVYGPMSLAAE